MPAVLLVLGGGAIGAVIGWILGGRAVAKAISTYKPPQSPDGEPDTGFGTADPRYPGDPQGSVVDPAVQPTMARTEPQTAWPQLFGSTAAAAPYSIPVE